MSRDCHSLGADGGTFRIRHLGVVPYETCWRWMRDLTRERDSESQDEIWLLQHPPVYTRGLSCRQQPRSAGAAIPMIDTDRGGQITYHGPGQVIAYVLMDVRRRGWGPRRLVFQIEQAVIDLLSGYGATGVRRDRAPGVYVAEAKVAAIGLRVSRGSSYHGVSLNVDLDLTPFEYIDPCGYHNLQVTCLRDLGIEITCDSVRVAFADQLVRALGDPAGSDPPVRPSCPAWESAVHGSA